MNKIFKILPFFLLITFGCKAQNEQPSDFIPKGYTEFEKYTGDLNKDGFEDCVLVIKKKDSANVVMNRFDKKVDRNRRGIIVLSKRRKVMNLLIKTWTVSHPRMKMVVFIFRQSYGLKLKTKNSMCIMDTADMDIGNIPSDFKTQILN